MERYTGEEGVRHGSVSALLHPSSTGNSFIRYEVPLAARFQGGYVQLSVWVKSSNTIPEAIQVDIQDGVGPVAVQSYANSGDWEQLVVGRYIDAGAKRVLITLNVKATATGSAFFDSASIMTTLPSPVPTATSTPVPTPQLIPFAEFTNGSFESWAPSLEGLPLPEQWVYHQYGTGGSVEKHTLEDGVREGVASALVRPSSTGNSFIRYAIPLGVRFRDGCTRFGAHANVGPKSEVGRSI